MKYYCPCTYHPIMNPGLTGTCLAFGTNIVINPDSGCKKIDLSHD